MEMFAELLECRPSRALLLPCLAAPRSHCAEAAPFYLSAGGKGFTAVAGEQDFVVKAAWTHASHWQEKTGSDAAAAKGRDGSSLLVAGERAQAAGETSPAGWLPGLGCHRPGCPGSGGSLAAVVPAPLRGEGCSLPPLLRGGVWGEQRTPEEGRGPRGGQETCRWWPGTGPPPLQPAGREICGRQDRIQPRTARSGTPLGNGIEVTRG